MVYCCVIHTRQTCVGTFATEKGGAHFRVHIRRVDNQFPNGIASSRQEKETLQEIGMTQYDWLIHQHLRRVWSSTGKTLWEQEFSHSNGLGDLEVSKGYQAETSRLKPTRKKIGSEEVPDTQPPPVRYANLKHYGGSNHLVLPTGLLQELRHSRRAVVKQRRFPNFGIPCMWPWMKVMFEMGMIWTQTIFAVAIAFWFLQQSPGTLSSIFVCGSFPAFFWLLIRPTGQFVAIPFLAVIILCVFKIHQFVAQEYQNSPKLYTENHPFSNALLHFPTFVASHFLGSFHSNAATKIQRPHHFDLFLQVKLSI